jgi:hypothetical protein
VTTDILEMSRLVHGSTFKLDLLCEYNSTPMKSGSLLAAIQMAADGRFDALREYCADDVRILNNLYRKQYMRHPRTDAQIDLSRWSPLEHHHSQLLEQLDDLAHHRDRRQLRCVAHAAQRQQHDTAHERDLQRVEHGRERVVHEPDQRKRDDAVETLLDRHVVVQQPTPHVPARTLPNQRPWGVMICAAQAAYLSIPSSS